MCCHHEYSAIEFDKQFYKLKSIQLANSELFHFIC